jgi:hypothetical protein
MSVPSSADTTAAAHHVGIGAGGVPVSAQAAATAAAGRRRIGARHPDLAMLLLFALLLLCMMRMLDRRLYMRQRRMQPVRGR